MGGTSILRDAMDEEVRNFVKNGGRPLPAHYLHMKELAAPVKHGSNAGTTRPASEILTPLLSQSNPMYLGQI